MTTAEHTTPRLALPVSDLAASLAFYVEGVGCELLARDDAADTAVVAWAGDRLLLAGPRAGALAGRAGLAGEVAKPRATVFLAGGSPARLEQQQAALAARGLTGAELIRKPWGDVSLVVPTPDGARLAFWTLTERAPAEALALYASAPERLELAVAGLTPEEELLAPAEPDEWSIREIVHHLVDSDATVLFRTKFGLAEPGRLLHGNPYAQDQWAQGLAYRARPIAPAVALFRAIRAHMTQLLETIPDAWTRDTVAADGTRMAAGTMIGMLVSHAEEHIERIGEIRALHGR